MGIFKNIGTLAIGLVLTAVASADVVVRFNNAGVFTDQNTAYPTNTIIIPQSIEVEVDGAVVPEPISGRTGQIVINYDYANPLFGYDTNLSIGPDISIGLHTNQFLHPNYLAERTRSWFIGPVLDFGYFAGQPVYFASVEATRFVDNPLGIYVSPSHYCDLTITLTESPYPLGDINYDGIVSLNDLYSILHYYMLNRLEADFNRDGVVSLQDIFDFLNIYYTI